MLSYCIWKAIQRAIKGAGASWGKLERTAERARAGRIVWIARASPCWRWRPGHRGLSILLKRNKPPTQSQKEPLRAQTVMFHPQNISDLLEQPFGLARGNDRRYHWRRHAPDRSD